MFLLYHLNARTRATVSGNTGGNPHEYKTFDPKSSELVVRFISCDVINIKLSSSHL